MKKRRFFFNFLGAKVQALGYGKVPRITGKIIASSKYEICQVDLVKWTFTAIAVALYISTDQLML